jgi:hypothetical protein
MIELLTKTYHVKFPECFDFNEPQKSVNRLHIHFPDLEEDHLKKALIHLSFREEDYLPIEENEFKLFDIKRPFGDVVAHYPHIAGNLFCSRQKCS